MRSIDIDVGGTFTDMVLTYDERRVIAKSPTTPYDLSVCFLNVLEDGAAQLGAGLETLLPNIEIMRYSTTVAMNRLIERRGPRLGFITTEGHEEAVLIGRGAQWCDGLRISERRNLAVQFKPKPLIERSMIAGVKERVDSAGRVLRTLDEEDVRLKLRTLIDNGARAIAVSLLWSFANPVHEKQVKAIIREEYKGYHIGYLPVVLSHEVVGKVGEYERSITAILDAYLQKSIKLELEATWDKLRDRGYNGTFLLTHNSGGSAEMFKTTASRTYNGGPISGLMGTYHLGRALGYKNVIASDVGGTSFDLGLVVDAGVRSYEFRPVIDRWMVGISMLQTTTIGAGGGSIARYNELLNRLEVGPRSAGAMPGPACYNLGGKEPTVTDADVVLGYIAPDAYYSGRMPLSVRKAHSAIEEKIARPLGVTVDEAAGMIRRVVEENMASSIRREVHLRGYHPEDFAIFAFGGGGPTHVAGYRSDIPLAVIFPQAPVFCALGSSVMDIMHVYEMSKRMVFMQPNTEKFIIDRELFNRSVERLIEQAKIDLHSENLDVASAVFELELDMLYGGQVHVKRFTSAHLTIRSDQDVQDIYDAFEKEFSETFSPHVVNKPGGVYLDAMVLKAIIPTEKPVMQEFALDGEDADHAKKGSRNAYWPELNTRIDTYVYQFEQLAPGNSLEGPALIEAEFTTIVVPPGQFFHIDHRGLGLLEYLPGHAPSERGMAS
ncbi:MAG: hydantoinase/oxoprolinase family protein [Gammaproteobacteria bacterium]|nr:hydantoinase/oxoprolinase family protein [Gammaproteobacteria bacterium]MDE0284000.1 hydantoinase/oxoprolinase family protein [Gammaproteobacteria bacterium]MDE0510480.1 hydantoinase/oxoprolinase family protein [Gammaproteobacteria bacterium]